MPNELQHQGALWPYMRHSDRADWQAECCAERNVIFGSEREAICDSVLKLTELKVAEEMDARPKHHSSASYVGEDEDLLWTAQGARSPLGFMAWAREGAALDSSFLRIQPLSLQEGLQLGFWKITKKSDKSILETAATGVAARMRTSLPNRSFLDISSSTWTSREGLCHEVAELQSCAPTMVASHWLSCGKKNGLLALITSTAKVKLDARSLKKRDRGPKLEECNVASNEATAFLWQNGRCFHITDSLVSDKTKSWEMIDPCDWPDERASTINMFRTCDRNACSGPLKGNPCPE